jgi:long-chain acyl-CoA synthetase
MTTVSSATETRVQEFWKGFVPAGEAQNPILWHRRRDSWRSISYKDLNAQANCAAAFLMARGLKKGDAVAVLAKRSVDYLVLDLALQFLGAVNLTLHPDTSLDAIKRLNHTHRFRFIYYGDASTFQAHGQLEQLKPSLHTVMVSGEDVEGLDADKVVTFDRVVGLGKSDWRESAPQLNDMKAAVTTRDTYTLEYSAAGTDHVREVSFGEMLSLVETATGIYQEQGVRLVFNHLHPHQLHLRTHGIFPAIRLKSHCYLLPSGDLQQSHFAELRPQALVTDAAGLNRLHAQLPEFMGNGAEKAFEKARAVVDRREEALSQGKKDPFFNRIRYRTGNRKLYRRVVSTLGGQFNSLVCEPGQPDPVAKRFFQECGITMTGLI